MKVIRQANHLKLIGKGWEVKAKLQELSKINLTVKDYLNLFSH